MRPQSIFSRRSSPATARVGLSNFSPRDFGKLSAWVDVLLVGLTYLFVALLANAHPSAADGRVFVVFPAQAIGLAMALLRGPKMLLAVFAGQLCASLAAGVVLPSAIGAAAGTMVAIAAGVVLLGNTSFDKALRGTQDYFHFLFGAVAVSLLSACFFSLPHLLAGKEAGMLWADFTIMAVGCLASFVTISALLLLGFNLKRFEDRTGASSKARWFRLCTSLLLFVGIHQLGRWGGHLSESHLLDFAFIGVMMLMTVQWGLRISLPGATVYMLLLGYYPRFTEFEFNYFFNGGNVLYHPMMESGLFSLYATIIISALALNLREKHYHIGRNAQMELERSHLIGLKKDMIRNFGHEIGTPLAALEQTLHNLSARTGLEFMPEKTAAIEQIRRIKRTSNLLQSYYSLISGKDSPVRLEATDMAQVKARLMVMVREFDPMGRIELSIDLRLRDNPFKMPLTNFLAIAEELIRNALDHGKTKLAPVKVKLELFDRGLVPLVGLSVSNDVDKQQLDRMRLLRDRLVSEKYGLDSRLDIEELAGLCDSDHHRDGHLGLGLAVAGRLSVLVNARMGIRLMRYDGQVVTFVHVPVQFVPGEVSRSVSVSAADAQLQEEVKQSGLSTTQTESLPESQKQISQSRLFVVDDCQLNLKLAKARLRNLGNQILLFSDPRDAVVSIISEAKCGDVILMDLQMPGLSGYEATRLIRQALPRLRLTVFAYTASSELECAEELAQNGLDGYISKLEPTAGVCQRIKSALRQNREVCSS